MIVRELLLRASHNEIPTDIFHRVYDMARGMLTDLGKKSYEFEACLRSVLWQI